MVGLLSGLDRKNCWSNAEHRGGANLHGLQHLLSHAKWEADAVRDDLRSYVDEGFGDPDEIMVVDETSDPKKGTRLSVCSGSTPARRGVSRTRRRRVSDLYRGAGSCIDRSGVVSAEVRDGEFGDIRRGGCARWHRVRDETRAGRADGLRRVGRRDEGEVGDRDEVYGNNTDLRTALEHRNVGYVMAVSCGHQLPSRAEPVRSGPVRSAWPVDCRLRRGRSVHRGGRHERVPLVFLGAAGAARRPAGLGSVRSSSAD